MLSSLGRPGSLERFWHKHEDPATLSWALEPDYRILMSTITIITVLSVLIAIVSIITIVPVLSVLITIRVPAIM